jgi:hypothetical protein
VTNLLHLRFQCFVEFGPGIGPASAGTVYAHYRYTSRPATLDFPDADVMVAPIIEAGGFRVRVPGHALRDLLGAGNIYLYPSAVGLAVVVPGTVAVSADGLSAGKQNRRKNKGLPLGRQPPARDAAGGSIPRIARAHGARHPV